MHELDRSVNGPAATGEVPDNEGYIEAVYGRLGIEATLGTYLDGGSGDEAVSTLLAEFSTCLADVAMSRGGVDVATVRFGVDHLTRSMNEACSSRFGYQPPKTLSEAVRHKLGITEPEPRRYVHGLDDRYWTKQFPEEYAGEKLAKRLPNETDRQYLGRHIHTSIRGLILEPFTYMR